MKALLTAVGIVVLTAPIACAPQKPNPAPQVDRTGDSEAKNSSPADTDREEYTNPPTKSDIPKLVAAIAGPDTDERWRAARALGDFGPAAAPAVPSLVKALTDDDPRVRGHAARALGLIEDGSDGTIRGLVALVADPEPRVRRAAITALARLRAAKTDTLLQMIQALDDADPAVVMPALQALAERGSDAVPALIEALQHPKGRYWACIGLAEIGPPAKAAVPQLASLLKDDSPEVRMEATMALGEIGPDADAAVPALTEKLTDATTAVRYAAAFSLGKIGGDAALPALQKAEQDQDPFLSMVAAWAVAKLKPADKQAVNKAVGLIVAALKQQDVNVRRGAAKALWELNAPLEIVAPALMAALEDPDADVQSNVYAGLASLGPDAVPRLIEKLKDTQLQGKVLRVLGLIGPQAKAAVPHLADALATADAPQRRELLFTLARIGPASAEATPAIVTLLADADQDVQVAACYALGKIGPAAIAAADMLQQNLDSQDRTLRLVSIWALLRIKPDDAKIVQIAIPQLTGVVTEGETELARTEAAAALGDIGEPAKSAVPALQQALADESPVVRAAAAEALKKIGE